MPAYDVKGKCAVVSGAGSDELKTLNPIYVIQWTLEQLLEAGCSVMMAELRLQPEAETALSKYRNTKADSGGVSGVQAWGATFIRCRLLGLLSTLLAKQRSVW